MNKPIIEIIQKPFDLNFYQHHIKLAILQKDLPLDARITKLKSLVQRAYEQGIVEAKKDKTYFDDY